MPDWLASRSAMTLPAKPAPTTRMSGSGRWWWREAGGVGRSGGTALAATAWRSSSAMAAKVRSHDTVASRRSTSPIQSERRAPMASARSQAATNAAGPSAILTASRPA